MIGLLTNTVSRSESRKGPRLPICVLVEEAAGPHDYLDKSRDISCHGMLIETDDPKAVGETLTVRFALPGLPPITVQGIVKRVTPLDAIAAAHSGMDYAMALEFTMISPEAHILLDGFIAASR